MRNLLIIIIPACFSLFFGCKKKNNTSEEIKPTPCQSLVPIVPNFVLKTSDSSYIATGDYSNEFVPFLELYSMGWKDKEISDTSYCYSLFAIQKSSYSSIIWSLYSKSTTGILTKSHSNSSNLFNVGAVGTGEYVCEISSDYLDNCVNQTKSVIKQKAFYNYGRPESFSKTNIRGTYKGIMLGNPNDTLQITFKINDLDAGNGRNSYVTLEGLSGICEASATFSRNGGLDVLEKDRISLSSNYSSCGAYSIFCYTPKNSQDSLIINYKTGNCTSFSNCTFGSLKTFKGKRI